MLQVNPHLVPPPPVGSVGVGEILVDAATRRQWLGVAASQDAAQALLIGDIVALQAEDADIRVDFTALLNTGLQGKSDIGHTHTASEITDFANAVNAVVGPGAGVPVGCILIYSGALTDIGVGNFAHYALCNGNNGTPNLVDKFVYGAGITLPGVGGGSKDLNGYTGFAGQHSHGSYTGWTSLTVAQMPHHAHAVYDPGHAHSLSSMSHYHSYTRYAALQTLAVGGGAAGGVWVGTSTVNTVAKDPTGSVVAAGTGIGIYGEGGNEAHIHTIGWDGNHQHQISIAGGNLPPYVALAFIMKIS